jgi:hypothetical protein
MEQSIRSKRILIASAVVVTTLLVFVMFKSCNTPAPSPAVDRLESINDSLYRAIEKNNAIANNLYAKIDSLTMRGDTIIQLQDVTNQYYRNDVYQILNSDDATADRQFRATLKKSDSLLKSGFYSKTYDLRGAANESELH